jgi:hypothetical protein
MTANVNFTRSCTVILVVLIAVAGLASAGPLTIALDSATLTGAPGTSVEFFGTITNLSPSTVYLNSDSVTLAGFGPGDFDDSPFFANAPFFLDPGDNSGDIGLFTVSIPLGMSPAAYLSTFDILGGETSDDQTIVGSVDFTVQVQPASGVPEPASVTEVGGALAALGSFAAIRRKRRSRA